MDFIGEVEATLCFDNVLELRHDIAVLPIQGELSFPVVVVEIFGVHGGLSLALSAKPLTAESSWGGVVESGRGA